MSSSADHLHSTVGNAPEVFIDTRKYFALFAGDDARIERRFTLSAIFRAHPFARFQVELGNLVAACGENASPLAAAVAA